MNNELTQRMQALKEEMEQIERLMQVQMEESGRQPIGQEQMDESGQQPTEQMQEAVTVLEDQEQQIQKQNRQENTAEESVRKRITELQEISTDPYFDQFLGRLLFDMDSGKVSPERILAEAERAWLSYQEKPGPQIPVPPNRQQNLTLETPAYLRQSQTPEVPVYQQQNLALETPAYLRQSQTPETPVYQQQNLTLETPAYLRQSQTPETPVYQQRNLTLETPAYILQNQTQDRQQGVSQEKKSSQLEFTIGAGVLSIVGALFILTAFITFGLTQLEGLLQGLFLYVLAAAVILISELLLQKKLPVFAQGITGLGIAGLYASTIINYSFLETINSLVALFMTLVISIVSILLSRKKDSVSIRLISFIGCYICFLPAFEFATELEFLIIAIILFMINGVSVFFPIQKNKNLIHLLHMCFNTLFTMILLFNSGSGIGSLYFIFYMILNIVFLNVVYMRQEKRAIDTAFYCVELGILGFLAFMLAMRPAMGDPARLLAGPAMQIYIRMIALVLTFAVCVFFYIFARDRREKIIQYHYFMIFSLLLLTESGVALENLLGVLVLFISAKLFSGRKEFEIMNCVVTVFAFLNGLSYYDSWPAWILFGAFALSMLWIRRWHLFYRYAISLFLVSFIGLHAEEFNWFIPIAAALLFGLLPAFHYSKYIPVLKRKKNAENEETEQNKEREDMMEMVYNITNLCALGLLSLLAVFCESFLSAGMITVIGAISIILYLSPKFYLDMKKKYMVLAGYLTVMAFIIPVSNPVFVSLFLMIIAIGCVAAGFKLMDKAQRLCGLVLALFVCIKLVLFDFREAGSLQKTILFLIVGSIALAISLIYIQLEKKRSEVKPEEGDPLIIPEDMAAIQDGPIVIPEEPITIQEDIAAPEPPEMQVYEQEVRKEDRDENEKTDEI